MMVGCHIAEMINLPKQTLIQSVPVSFQMAIIMLGLNRVVDYVVVDYAN